MSKLHAYVDVLAHISIGIQKYIYIYIELQCGSRQADRRFSQVRDLGSVSDSLVSLGILAHWSQVCLRQAVPVHFNRPGSQSNITSSSFS